MIVYTYIGAGATFDRIPARELTEDAYERALAGRSMEEQALIGTLYKRTTRKAAPKPAPIDEPTTRADGAQPAEQAEEAIDGNTDRI